MCEGAGLYSGGGKQGVVGGSHDEYAKAGGAGVHVAWLQMSWLVMELALFHLWKMHNRQDPAGGLPVHSHVYSWKVVSNTSSIFFFFC